MAAKEYLLKLPELMGETIRLAPPCVVAREADGTPVDFDALDPRSFGRSFLAEAGPDLVWQARTQVKSLDKLKELYGFHCGAIISPRVKEIIEAETIPNVEFIPVRILYRNTDEGLGTWWYVNVFNWRKVFDFGRSEVRYVDFYQPVTGLRTISRRFGERAVSEWDVLEVNRDETTDGLFLAEGPSESIWYNVFVTTDLAEKINRGVPKKKQIYFPQFWLDRGPGPAFDLSGYRFAGKK